MIAPFCLDVYREDLARIAQSVFRTMMDLDPAECREPWTHTSDTVTAAIHFVGEWRGAALLECREKAALGFACRFVGGAEAEGIDGDVRDVMGEVANMIAGNLKSLLPKGVGLSMPTIVEGRHYALHICGVTAVEEMVFTTAVGDFKVTLVEMPPPA